MTAILKRTAMAATFLGGLLAVGARPAHATLIISPTATITPDVGGTYKWTYDASTPGVGPGFGELHTGDYFTIFDFYGFTGQHAEPPVNWVFTTELVASGCPGLPNNSCNAGSGDNPAVVNLKWTYVGPNGPQGNLGAFSAWSTSGTVGLAGWFGTTHVSGNQTYSNGQTQVPVAPPPVPVPEPGTLLLLGTGLAGLARAARRRAPRTR